MKFERSRETLNGKENCRGNGRRTGVGVLNVSQHSAALWWTAVAAKLHFAPKKRHFAKKAPVFFCLVYNVSV